MTPATTRAWILLSVPDTGGQLDKVIGMADALNHAIPTDLELRDSLGWLRSAGLIQKEGNIFLRTPDGNRLVSQHQSKHRAVFKLWDAVAESLEQLSVTDYQEEQLAEESIQAAHAKYHREFRKLNRKLSGKDI
jgi:hypothetical protein